eukprot:8560006-Pyramimonas_sp.AAC.1
MQTLHTRVTAVQEECIARILQLQTTARVEQRMVIGTIRQARALLYCNDNASVAQWRNINEEI